MVSKVFKLLSVFFSVLAVLLCGCSEQNAAPSPPVLHFRADFSAGYRGMQLCGSVDRTRRDVCELTFSAPDTLNGLRVRRQHGVVTMQYATAAATADESYLPGESFPSQLFSLLTAAEQGGLHTTDGTSYTVTLPGGEGKLTVDSRRLPQSAVLPDSSTVRFTNAEE